MAVMADFEQYKIKKASIQYLNADGTSEQGKPFGCMGTIEQTPTVEQVTKTCEGALVKSRSKTTDIQVAITAHVNQDVVREIFGMHNDQLKEGVWAYGNNKPERPFIFTAEVEDMDGAEVKMIAYSNAHANEGFTFSIDNAATELALMNVTIGALQDDNGEFYYEAIKSEVTDTEVIDGWHTNWSRELIEVAP